MLIVDGKIRRQAMYLLLLSYSHCCRGKAFSITYYKCDCSLRYPACNRHAPCYIVKGGLSGSETFFQSSAILPSDKHNYIDMCMWILHHTTTCFGCPHQPSSGRALVHKKNKRGEASSYQQWV